MTILQGLLGPCDPPCPPVCKGDFNGDCVVNLVDVAALQANFGTMQELQKAVTDAQSDVAAAIAALAAAVGTEAIAAAQANLAAAEQALAEAQATLADPKPGLGPNGEWSTVNLDVNFDGEAGVRR